MPERETWQSFECGAESDLAAFVAGLVPGRPVRIVLAGDRWGPKACEMVAGLRPGLDLRFLCLRGAPLGDGAVAALAESPALDCVRVLCIERCGISDAGVRALVRVRCRDRLQTLCLCNRDGIETGPLNAIGDAGALDLAATPNLPGLQDLDLWNTQVGDRGFAAIAASPRLARLASVYAWGTRLTADGAGRIKAIAWERWRSPDAESPKANHCAFHTDWDQRNITWTDDGYA